MRKYLFSLFLLVLLLGITGCRQKQMSQSEGPQLEVQQDETLQVVLATDLHYLSPALTDRGWYFEQLHLYGDGRQMLYQQEILEAFVADMLELAPDAILLAGDLTYNGERRSHEDLVDLLMPLKDAGIPVYVIPGNHDIDNWFARSFFGEDSAATESIQADDFPKIYRRFGYGGTAAKNPAQVVSRSKDELSYQVLIDEKYSIYMLSTSGNGLPEETFNWLEKRLAEDKEKGHRPFVVGHHNLLVHNEMFVGGYVMKNAEDVTNLLAEYEVPLYLSGHMHIQHEETEEIALMDGRKVIVRDIASSSLMVNPHQYGVITLEEDGGILYENHSVKVAEYAKEQGLTDPNLLDFAAYTESFYRENQEEKVRASLVESCLTEEEVEIMADFLGRVNVSYFAGMTPQECEAFREEEAYHTWQEAAEKAEEASGWMYYLESILER